MEWGSFLAGVGAAITAVIAAFAFANQVLGYRLEQRREDREVEDRQQAADEQQQRQLAQASLVRAEVSFNGGSMDIGFVNDGARRAQGRCATGCIALENARGISSDTDSHSFLCHRCGGAVCIGCRTTPVVGGLMFCTPCGNAQAAMSAEAFPQMADGDDYDDAAEIPCEPMTAGQMRALLAGVGEDVPLVALHGPHLTRGVQQWEIAAARQILQGEAPRGPVVRFALYLEEADDEE